MTKNTNTNPAGLHFGPVPQTAEVLAQIRNSHKLGFRTILATEYTKLSAKGITVESFDMLLDSRSLEGVEIGQPAATRRTAA